ncbi:PREDICTED: uncharacterized protein LOC102018270 [Chinchilla lanigera]|uniref:uncharacterized protein LOC102018270 n=1 Tax=Chinchilla lanigera TaxID=34839 RepID=UPI00038E9A8D|nr:PREDICTED: uncharacterized protein LOC102018270 [Chinchilla lanigera]
MPSPESCPVLLQDQRCLLTRKAVPRPHQRAQPARGPVPRGTPPLTAHHQQQDHQQRGHEHQQGQPHVVPHLESRRVAASARGRGQRAGFSGGQRGPGAAWAEGAPRRRPPEGEHAGGNCGGRPLTLLVSGTPTPSSLRGAGAAARGDPTAGRMRFHGGRCASEERVRTGTHGSHKALVAAHGRISRSQGTPDVNVSRRRSQLPLRHKPLSSYGSSSPSAPSARLRRGAGVTGRWSTDPDEGRRGPLCGNYNSQNAPSHGASRFPPSLHPLCLWAFCAKASFLAVRAAVLSACAVGYPLEDCAEAPVRFQPLLGSQSPLKCTERGKGRRLPEKLVAREPTPIAWSEDWVLGALEVMYFRNDICSAVNSPT